jgi:hypothetical protein
LFVNGILRELCTALRRAANRFETAGAEWNQKLVSKWHSALLAIFHRLCFHRLSHGAPNAFERA